MAKTTSKKKPKKKTTSLKKTTKKAEKKPSVKKKSKEKKEGEVKKEKYIEAIGRRKTASARTRIFLKSKEKTFLINKKEANLYFPDFELQKIIFSPLKKTSTLDKFKIEIQVKGGGKRGQAEAVRLGISRALIQEDIKLRGVLKSVKYLTRDPRKKERKKFGLKKARRAPQWSKR